MISAGFCVFIDASFMRMMRQGCGEDRIPEAPRYFCDWYRNATSFNESARSHIIGSSMRPRNDAPKSLSSRLDRLQPMTRLKSVAPARPVLSHRSGLP